MRDKLRGLCAKSSAQPTIKKTRYLLTTRALASIHLTVVSKHNERVVSKLNERMPSRNRRARPSSSTTLGEQKGNTTSLLMAWLPYVCLTLAAIGLVVLVIDCYYTHDVPIYVGDKTESPSRASTQEPFQSNNVDMYMSDQVTLPATASMDSLLESHAAECNKRVEIVNEKVSEYHKVVMDEAQAIQEQENLVTSLEVPKAIVPEDDKTIMPMAGKPATAARPPVLSNAPSPTAANSMESPTFSSVV